MDRIVGAPISAPTRDLVERLALDDDTRPGFEPEPDTAPAIPAFAIGGVSWR